MQGKDGLKLSVTTDVRRLAEQNNDALQRVFAQRIHGWFLIDIKEQVMKALGLHDLTKYYDFYWSDMRMITGIGEAPEYDICRMIVGIHRAYSIFLTDDEIRRKEKSRKYKKQLVDETIEKIMLRLYGSVYFRKTILFQGEEFLYYPLPYELFAMTARMSEILVKSKNAGCGQLYYGVIYNVTSALFLLEDNLLGTAYPLCRGAIEMYLKLLILSDQPEAYTEYENFRMFEVSRSCKGGYPEEFNKLFDKRMCKNVKAKADYLHFGWVDSIEEYHCIAKESPYYVYGMFHFLGGKVQERKCELEQLEELYKWCHAYTHGSVQTAKYPILHYFEITIMLYHIIRGTFLMLCAEKNMEITVNGQDIIAMIDRDFDVLYEQYKNRSTENFERYYHEDLHGK